MVEKFYFDTSIWLDYYEKRGKNGEAALDLINKIIKENHIILCSPLVIKELKNLGYFLNEINDIFSIAKPDNIRLVNITKEQIKEMEKIAPKRDVPKKDVLHAILARDYEAQLITRDYHFQKLKDITLLKLPEEFI